MILDYPKLFSPYVRKTNDAGDYIVTPEVDLEFQWVFEDGVQAVEKLDGTNVSIIVKNGEIVEAYNRLTAKQLLPVKHTQWSGALVEGLAWAMRHNLMPQEDGQHFGELIGEILQGNPLGIRGHCWVSFERLKQKCAWHSWIGNKYPKTFEAISLWFKEDLKSLFAKRYFQKDIMSEGIVFYHPDGRQAKLRRDMFDWFEGRRHKN